MNKVLLTIFDGFGMAPDSPGNAISLAKTPNLDHLLAKYPHSILQCTGEAVGLTEGAMGGSEVGHFTMGAGRITPQFLLQINRAIEDGSFRENVALKGAFEHAKKSGKLHLMGMISDEGVHSHIEHLFELLEWAKAEGLEQVFIHCIGDGRDVEERSIKRYLEQVQSKIDSVGVGKIATVVGRYYAMDRDRNFDRTEVAYRMLTEGKTELPINPALRGANQVSPPRRTPEASTIESPSDITDSLTAVDHFYAADPKLTDYYLPPAVLDKNGLIESGDAVIFFNYRTDRTKQLTAAFTDPNFSEFKTSVSDLHFVCMGPYSKIAPVAFSTPKIENNLAQVLSKNAIPQLRVAETEKYAHVTFFFNSQIEHHVPLEDRILVQSPKVPSYDQKPEMSAAEVTEKVVQALRDSHHPVIIVNYANGDLVGHSGSLEASIKAVETLDESLGKLYEQAMESGYTLLLTGDHGNCDDMLYPDGSQKPAHSMNPVMFLVASPTSDSTDPTTGTENTGTSSVVVPIKTVQDGGLSDVAPTVLKLLGIEKPAEMTGESLV